MAFIQKKTPEERARKAAIKEQGQREAAARREAERREKERQAFERTPAGQARAAFERGDHVFQYSIDVMNQQSIVHSMASLAPTGVKTKTRSKDPTGVLNSVCDEGWELVNGSFVFLEEGETSRKQALSSKVQSSVKGTVVGYYLFRRCEANKGATPQLEAEPPADSTLGQPSSFGRATHALRLGDLEGSAVMFRQLRDRAIAVDEQETVVQVDQFISQLPSSLSADELAIFETYFQHPERFDG
jgi:hypothetical protein